MVGILSGKKISSSSADASPHHSTAIAKITMPKASGIIKRQRLFDHLDSLHDKPITWIAAPAGSGKTTLVSSWLSERKLHSLWYQLDEGDAHLADFFYYMSLASKKASPRSKGALPLLTPEYLQGIPVFTRKYFEMLFDRLRKPSIVVLDNYQDVPEHTSFQQMMAHGLETIPEGVRVLVVSRREPPKENARLYACEKIHRLNWDDLRFSFDEFNELVCLRGAETCGDGQKLRNFYEKTDGWAAGITLYLENISRKGIDSSVTIEQDQQQIFNYFAGVIFKNISEETQDFLIRTSFLPVISVHMAEQLTGLGSSGRLLSEMSRQSLFTKRHTHRESEFQYHPLFREFLQARAHETFAAEELMQIQEEAAQALEEAGHMEYAAELYCASARWDRLTALIRGNVQNFLAQGRSDIVEEWMEKIPESYQEENPSVLYWRGLCRQPRDPFGSRVLYERAFPLFEKSDDWAGLYLTWARTVEAVIMEWSHFTILDSRIAWLDKIMKERDRPFPSHEIEADVAMCMLYALTHRQFDHPDIAWWAERALFLTEKASDKGMRFKALIYASQYYTFMGDRAHILIVLDEMKNIVHLLGHAPLLSIQCAFMEAATHCWTDISSAGVEKAVSDGLACADRNSLHLFDHLLYQMVVMVSLNRGDVTRAGEYLKHMALSLGQHRQALCQHHHLNAWYVFLHGDLSRAEVHAGKSLQIALENGMFYSEVISRHLMAQILKSRLKHDEARVHLDRLCEMAECSRSPAFLFTSLMAEARFAMEDGDDEKCLVQLRSALHKGREHELTSIFWWWDPPVMSRLCVMALDNGIEEEYVKSLIRLRALQPDRNALVSSQWPGHLTIGTFGGFSLHRDGQKVEFSGKVPQKPVMMLKVLTAAGDRGTSEDSLIDLLWPDAEGHRGSQSLKSTLHLLRKLIGHEAVRLQGGVVTLDPELCWTDVRAWRELVSRVDSLWMAKDGAVKAASLSEKLLSLYNGDFLAGEERPPWILPLREAFRSKFMSIVTMLGAFYEKAERHEEAMRCYRKGASLYPHHEVLCRAARCASRHSISG